MPRGLDVKARLLDGQVDPAIPVLRPHRDQNKERMRYDECRARGMQIGSGQNENCSKQLVASRFKRSRCKWTARGANALLALKCCWKNLQWEEFAL